MAKTKMRFGDFKPRFPLLEQMRAERAERERGALAALELCYRSQGDMLREAWNQIRELQNAKRGLEAILTTKVREQMVAQIAMDLSRALCRSIHDQVMNARSKSGKALDPWFVEIKIPVDLHMMSPHSIEKQVADEFINRFDLRVDDQRGPVEPKDKTNGVVHLLTFTIPSLSTSLNVYTP